MNRLLLLSLLLFAAAALAQVPPYLRQPYTTGTTVQADARVTAIVNIEATRANAAEKSLSNSWKNVKNYGAVGDNSTLDDAAFAATLVASTNYDTIFLPSSQSYRITAAIDPGTNKHLHFLGAGRGANADAAGGSRIYATVNGPAIRAITPGSDNGPVFENFNIHNDHASGIGIAVEGAINPAFRSLGIHAWIGIFQPTNSFCSSISDTRFTWSGNTAGSVGTLNACNLSSCDVVSYDTGSKLWGAAQVNVSACRYEVNSNALVLGEDHLGASFPLSGGNISGNSGEANDTFIWCKDGNGLNIAGNSILGSVNSPSAGSKYGLRLDTVRNSSIASTPPNGSFSKAAIYVGGDAGTTYGLTFSSMIAANTYSHPKLWDVACPPSSVTFNQCNFSWRASDTVYPATTTPDISTRAIAQQDPTTPYVKGKNLRGKNVSVATGLLAFTNTFATQKSSGVAGIASLVAQNSAGTLTNGLYYIASTIVTPHGECSGGMGIVTVAGSSNQISVAGFGTTQDGWVRRYYIGTVTNEWIGYVETTLNATPTVLITNLSASSFTGFRSPPVAGVDETSMVEPDGNYAVIVTPSWLTTIAVTNKSTTSFGMVFGAAAPSGGTIDWIMIR